MSTSLYIITYYNKFHIVNPSPWYSHSLEAVLYCLFTASLILGCWWRDIIRRRLAYVQKINLVGGFIGASAFFRTSGAQLAKHMFPVTKKTSFGVGKKVTALEPTKVAALPSSETKKALPLAKKFEQQLSSNDNLVVSLQLPTSNVVKVLTSEERNAITANLNGILLQIAAKFSPKAVKNSIELNGPLATKVDLSNDKEFINNIQQLTSHAMTLKAFSAKGNNKSSTGDSSNSDS
jgi:hypothetical protein